MPNPSTPLQNNPQGSTSTNGTPPLIPQIRFVPHNTSYARSLHFEAFSREVKNGVIIKVGRFTDKVQPSLSRIAFKSKVVSRAHAEVWTENGQFFIRDTKSSSGTFLNQQRLSPPNQESLPTPLKDGDILQLGVDYQGGVQDVFRCVRIRLEINRTWQHDQDNPFRKKALQTLDALKENLKQSGALGASTSDLEECCICLSALAPFQALFVSPCCHTFHYKCIYRLLIDGPSFVCPLCRTYADLDADVCTEEITEALEKSSINGNLNNNIEDNNNNSNSSPEQANAQIENNNVPSDNNNNEETSEHNPAIVEGTWRNQDLPPHLGEILTQHEENINTYSNEIQDCRTPANPTPNLFFSENPNEVNYNNTISNNNGPNTSSPSSLLSPNFGEVRN